MENVNNERNIFARFRTNNCGGSQLFENIDASLTWVQISTRNTVESGYARADFTVRDTEGNIYYKGYTTKSKYCYEVYCGRQCTETITALRRFLHGGRLRIIILRLAGAAGKRQDRQQQQ